MSKVAEKIDAVLAKAANGGFDDLGDGDAGTDSGDQSSAGNDDAGSDAGTQGGSNNDSGAQRAETSQRGRDDQGRFTGSNAAKAPQTVQRVGQPPATPGNQQQRQDAHGADEGDIDPDNRETWKPTHRIPYERFSKVIRERDSLNEEIAKLRRTIEIQQAVPQRQQFNPESTGGNRGQSAADDLFQTMFGEQANPNDPVQRQLAEFQQWKQQQEEAQADARLDQAVKYVTDKYPDVDEEDVLLHIARGARDLDEIGERLTAKAHRFYERGAARFQQERGTQQAAPQVSSQQQVRNTPPPRPKPAGSAGPSKSDKDGVNFADPDQRAKYLEQRLNQLSRT